jgi:hypothetical protein
MNRFMVVTVCAVLAAFALPYENDEGHRRCKVGRIVPGPRGESAGWLKGEPVGRTRCG